MTHAQTFGAAVKTAPAHQEDPFTFRDAAARKAWHTELAELTREAAHPANTPSKARLDAMKFAAHVAFYAETQSSIDTGIRGGVVHFMQSNPTSRANCSGAELVDLLQGWVHAETVQKIFAAPSGRNAHPIPPQ